MKDEILNCKYALDGKSIGRPCLKIEDRSCRYWGYFCPFDEGEEKRINIGQDSSLTWDDDDGYEG